MTGRHPEGSVIHVVGDSDNVIAGQLDVLAVVLQRFHQPRGLSEAAVRASIFLIDECVVQKRCVLDPNFFLAVHNVYAAINLVVGFGVLVRVVPVGRDNIDLSRQRATLDANSGAA